MPDSQSTALQALFHEVLAHFPDLKVVLPAWWEELEPSSHALQWATNLAAQGQEPSTLLERHSQRVSIFTRIFQPQSPATERYIPISP